MGKLLGKFKSTEEVDFLFVGLGNPGSKYSNTRHNLGAEAIESFAQSQQYSFAKVGVARFARHKTGSGLSVIAIPETFMNESGKALGNLVSKFKISDPDRIVIVHDELDLPAGTVRLKTGGGMAGHNGLKSVKQHLKTDQFSRLRIGIDRPQHSGQVSDYVLAKPRPGETALIEDGQLLAQQAIDIVIDTGSVEKAMAQVNAK